MKDNPETQSNARSLLQRLIGLFHAERRVSPPRTAYNQRTGKPLALKLEVAESAYARSKGLLGRDALAPDSGLWIYPCESVHTFAMRFPIDLVYLDRNNVVKKVRTNVRPGRMSACLSARSVMELPAGTIDATGTMPGDRITIAQPNSAPGEPHPEGASGIFE
jgi:uncharacterized membrane protein (UPF0127 family)